jgi:crotonobetainyl-CoA:carnitine CoA-transferase CaiB-like acyl-CoA transferase
LYKALGIPIKLSRTPGTVRSMPRALGADTREVCRQAGFDQSQIDEMIMREIVFEPR